MTHESINGMTFSREAKCLVSDIDIIGQLKIRHKMNGLSVGIGICFSNREYQIESGSPFLESY